MNTLYSTHKYLDNSLKLNAINVCSFQYKSTIFILQIISQFYMYIFLIKFLIVENFTFFNFCHKYMLNILLNIF